MDLSHGRGDGGGDERPLRYILEGHNAVPEPDLIKWAMWVEANWNKRSVRRQRLRGVVISTVFLAIDHSWNGGPPIVFETMTFGAGPFNGRITNRYATWEEAERGHEEVRALVYLRTRKLGGYRIRACEAIKRNRRQTNSNARRKLK